MRARPDRSWDHERAETVAPGEPAAETPIERILSLQQRVGNAAVARLVQRRERPQSTDVADVTGGHGHRGHSSKPGPKRTDMKDIHSRVIGVSIDQGMTKIAIGVGPDQGVEVGMAGYLAGSNGKPYEDFEIDAIRGGASYAHVRATTDAVSAHSQVVITPSRGGSPPVAHQQF